MATLNFNANEVEPSIAFEAIPAGKYNAVIIETEMKATKAENGHYLELTFEIIDGEYKGRKVWSRLNLDNPNAKAVQIAQGELSAICRAVNVMQPRDSTDLHNLPLEIGVKCKRNHENGEVSNEVKSYASKATTTPAAQSHSSSPPWQR